MPPDLAYWAAFGLSSGGELDEARELAAIGLRCALVANDATCSALLAGQLTFFALQRLDLDGPEKFAEVLRQIPAPHDIIACVRIHYAQAMVEAYKGDWRKVAAISRQWIRDVRLAGPFHQATAEVILAEALSLSGSLERRDRVSQYSLFALGP